jgi:hypothetical protein
MVSTPQMSVVEASSECYPQCREYRRTVALAKGPEGATFAVDIFRVKGGKMHAWRAFSEVAASDVADSSLSFEDIAMPPEPPIPDYGASEAPEHIAGLRDVRCGGSPPPSWRAVWSDAYRTYRLWMLSPTHRVQAGHGPGQETWEEAGRRVRCVEAIREGDDVESVFVAVHDPAGVVTNAEVVETISHADPNAVVVQITSEWGTYLIFGDCTDEVETDRVRFAGAFGALCIPLIGQRWYLTSGAHTLMTVDGFGFDSGATAFESVARRDGYNRIALETAIPREQQSVPDDVTRYVAIETDTLATGLPVARVDERAITVDAFPVPEDIRRVRYEAVRYASE